MSGCSLSFFAYYIHKMKRHLLLLLAIVLPLLTTAQGSSDKEWPAGPLSVTHHQLATSAGVMPYTATAGYMPVKDEKDSLKAKLFFVAYTKDGVQDKRERP